MSRRTSRTVAIMALSAVLIALWDGGFLFNDRVGVLDWKKELYYYHYLAGSLADLHRLPLSFLSIPEPFRAYPTLGRTASYWANPEVLSLSPLLPLMPFMGVVAFLKVYVFAHLLAGAYGVHRVGRVLRFSPHESLFLFVLLLLNPWLMQHLAIGYTPYVTVCLVPLAVALAADRRTGVWGVVGASLVNALIVYEGGLHIFLWFNGTFAWVVALLALRRRCPALLARPALFLAGTALLVLPKMAAVWAALGGWYRGPLGSYGSLADLWGLLTDTRTDPFAAPITRVVYGTSLYDGRVAVGAWYLVLAVLLLGAAAGLLASRRSLRRVGRFPFPELAAAAGVYLVLGWAGVWAAATRALHPLSVEHYPWRFLFIAVTLVSVLMAWSVWLLARRWLRPRLRPWVTLAVFLPLLVAWYGQNRALVQVATRTTDPVPAFRIAAELAPLGAFSRIGPLAVTATPGRFAVRVPPGTDAVRIPWITTRRQWADFEVEGARAEVVTDQGLLLLVAPGAHRVVLRPKDYHAFPLAAASLALYAGLFGWVGRRSARRRVRAGGP